MWCRPRTLEMTLTVSFELLSKSYTAMVVSPQYGPPCVAVCLYILALCLYIGSTPVDHCYRRTECLIIGANCEDFFENANAN